MNDSINQSNLRLPGRPSRIRARTFLVSQEQKMELTRAFRRVHQSVQSDPTVLALKRDVLAFDQGTQRNAKHRLHTHAGLLRFFCFLFLAFCCLCLFVLRVSPSVSLFSF